MSEQPNPPLQLQDIQAHVGDNVTIEAQIPGTPSLRTGPDGKPVCVTYHHLTYFPRSFDARRAPIGVFSIEPIGHGRPRELIFVPQGEDFREILDDALNLPLTHRG